MKKFSLLSALLAITAFLMTVSCEKPEPVTPDGPGIVNPGDDNNEENPEEEKPESGLPEAAKANTYVINGTEYAFSSTAIMNVGENLSIAASPEPDIKDVTSMMTAATEYFYAGISPILLDKEIDLMTEEALYTIYSKLKGCVIETLAPGETGEISKGRCKATYKDGLMTFKAGIVLTDGTTLAVNITAENNDGQIEVNENEIGVDDEVKPLRAAFYMEDKTETYLYFTPGNIEYFEELENVTSYMCLVVSTSLINGKEIGLDSISGEQEFMFAYMNNMTGDYTEITKDDLSEAEGKFCIKNPELGIYTVSFEFIVEGTRYHVQFDGECTSADKVKPEEQKEIIFSCGDEVLAIEGASLLKGEEVWTLSLLLENGKSADVTMSTSFWQKPGTFGFSQDKNMAVSYNGTTYSKNNGDKGTLTVKLDETAGTVEVEFTNYEDCEFYYNGKYTE